MSRKEKGIQKPKAISSSNVDRKGAKTAPIDSNFVRAI